MLLHRRVHVERELHDALARLVIRVFRLVLDRDAVPSLVARGEGVALREGRGLERPGAELRPGEATRVDDDFSIPRRRQEDLELGVVENHAVDVAMRNRRRTVLIGVDDHLEGAAGAEAERAQREDQEQCGEAVQDSGVFHISSVASNISHQPARRYFGFFLIKFDPS